MIRNQPAQQAKHGDGMPTGRLRRTLTSILMGVNIDRSSSLRIMDSELRDDKFLEILWNSAYVRRVELLVSSKLIIVSNISVRAISCAYSSPQVRYKSCIFEEYNHSSSAQVLLKQPNQFEMHSAARITTVFLMFIGWSPKYSSVLCVIWSFHQQPVLHKRRPFAMKTSAWKLRACANSLSQVGCAVD